VQRPFWCVGALTSVFLGVVDGLNQSFTLYESPRRGTTTAQQGLFHEIVLKVSKSQSKCTIFSCASFNIVPGRCGRIENQSLPSSLLRRGTNTTACGVVCSRNCLESVKITVEVHHFSCVSFDIGGLGVVDGWKPPLPSASSSFLGVVSLCVWCCLFQRVV
jgi:hypothetical protein